MDAISLLAIAAGVVATTAVVYLIFVNGVASKSYEEALADQRRAQLEVKEKATAVKKVWKPKKHRHERKKKDKTVSAEEARHAKHSTATDTSPEVDDAAVISAASCVDESADDTSARATPTPSPTPTPVPSSDTTTTTAATTTIATSAVAGGVGGVKANGLVKSKVAPAAPPTKPVTHPVDRVTSADSAPATSGGDPHTTTNNSDNTRQMSPKVNGTHSPTADDEEIAAAAPVAAGGGGVATVRKRRMADRRRGGGGGQANSAHHHANTDVSVQRVSAVIDSAVLSAGDIQTLIDLLLNKQTSSEWIATGGRPDPLSLMKKQVDELELRLLNKEKTVTSAEERLHQLRQQLNQELHRCSQLRRQLDEAVERHTAELARQKQQLQLAHDKETQLLKQQLLKQQQACSSQVVSKQELTRLTGELERVQSELGTARGECDQLRAAAADRDQLLQKQLQQLTAAVETAERERLAAADQLQQLRSVHGGVERENTTLRQQLTSAQEQQCQLAAAADERERHQLQQLQRHGGEVTRLLNELQETRLELAQAREESTMAVQKHQNGIQLESQQQQQLIEQMSRQLADHKQQLHQLQLQAVSDDRQLLLKCLGDTFPAVTSVKKDSSQWPSELSCCLQQVLSARVCAAVTEQQQQQQQEQQLPTNKPSHSDQATSTEVSDEKRQAATSDDRGGASEERGGASAERGGASAERGGASDGSESDDTSLAGDNAALKQQVTHYKNVLAETAAILTQLQSSVEDEETRWKQQLSDKQQQVEQLTAALAQYRS